MWYSWSWIWVLSMIGTVYIAAQRGRNVIGFFFLSLFTGPLALILLLLSENGPSRLNEGNDLEQQLRDMRRSLRALEERTFNLERLVLKLPPGDANVPVVDERAALPAIEPVVESAVVQEEAALEKQGDMELDFGRNWLSKIGIAVLALGVAFLISYTFKYFGPFVRIAFGFAVAGALFFVGIKLEAKEKLMNYGRALLGGAWGIIYFTTYAMHHFEASRIIACQSVDIFLLILVVAGMVAHVLKYKSEGMMSVVLCVAFVTVTLGQITVFTLVSLLFLTAGVLLLVWRFQWIRILVLGIVLTYGLHFAWVMPNMSGPGSHRDMMNLLFLLCYWAVFFLGVHLVSAARDEDPEKPLAAVNFGNIALASMLAYPLVLKLFFDQRFMMVLGAGLVYLAAALLMKQQGRGKMFVSDMAAAIFAITFSLSLKFLPTSTLIMWIIEVPFLLFVGTHFKERIYRYFSYGLFVVVAWRILFLVFERLPGIPFLGLTWAWYGFVCFWASIAMAGCFYLTRRVKADPETNSVDLLFDQAFSLAAAFYFSVWICSFVHQPWVAFSLLMQGLVFLGVGMALSLKRFRVYSYAAVFIGLMVFLLERITPVSDAVQWFIVICNALAVFGAYAALKSIQRGKPGELFEYEAEFMFATAVLFLVIVIHQYVPLHWISLSLGIASVAVILTGFFDGNKTERLGGMALLALTLGRVVFVDLSGLDIIFKIITLIVLGALFLGVSYIYNRFTT